MDRVKARCPKCGWLGAQVSCSYDMFGGFPCRQKEGTLNELEINKGWFLAQSRGKPTDQPAYDPTLWRKQPGYAKLKSEDIETNIDDGILYPEIVETISDSLKPGDKVLDVGCAGGHFYRTLQKWMGKSIDYTGCDITPEYIDFAREKYPDKTWTVADVRNLPFPDGSFDHVLCLFVLIHLDKDGVTRAIKELTRVAKKQVLLSGYFTVTRICGHQVSENASADYIYDVINLMELAVPGWDLEIIQPEEEKVMRIPVEVEVDSGWVEANADLPIISYVRLVKRKDGKKGGE